MLKERISTGRDYRIRVSALCEVTVYRSNLGQEVENPTLSLTHVLGTSQDGSCTMMMEDEIK